MSILILMPSGIRRRRRTAGHQERDPMTKVRFVDKAPRELRYQPGKDDPQLLRGDVEAIAEIFKTPLVGAYTWNYEECRHADPQALSARQGAELERRDGHRLESKPIAAARAPSTRASTTRSSAGTRTTS